MAGKPGKAKPSTNGKGDVLAKLKGLYEFMTSNNLETIEIDEADLHLRMVRRKTAPQQVPVPVMVAAGAAHAAPAAPSHASAPEAAPAPAGQTIKAPMMGIFYRAPSPSSPPFVKEGDKVKPGQLICMIEAMKVFNEIKAEFPFTMNKVLLENGKPVKAGQDLFLIEK
jgi:acetyl-CoA carboxylase biotin carboxyl carrier protein